MLRPRLLVDSLHQVSAELLRDLGVRGVLVDLDDTLLPSGADTLDASVAAWLGGLRPAGFPVAILSNGERERVATLAARFGCRSLALSGKPFAPAFRRALRLLGTRPSETAMIGDQLFTDVLGANMAGLVSILVRPLSPGKLPHTRMLRHLERMILRGGDRGGPVHR
ncbi:MAG TPA: YqeG family HAD IIIA-type phosphatase [Trueperaceae bacterium]|nr:YqeG family HAD IIIA-type phosphatase [Trueperaceae bacterium]